MSQLASNPMKITFATDGASLPITLFTHEAKIKGFEFSNYSVQTDKVVVQDSLGNDVWIGIGDTTLSAQEKSNIGWVHGLQVVSMIAGELLVYFE